MPSANEVLRWCNPLVGVLETQLDNTLAGDYGFEEIAGGEVPVATIAEGTATEDNSLVRISSGRVKDAATSETILNGVIYERSLSEPFSGRGTNTQSALSINHVAGNDSLHSRSWANRDYTFKVGGHYKPKTAYDEVLRFGDYPTWITGRIVNKRFTEQSMLVGFNTEPPQLKNLFPLNRFTDGLSEGEVIPFVVGHVRSMRPMPKSATTGVFHDGDCEGVVAAYDTAGNTLSLEAGDPTSDTVSAAGKYMADNSGNVAWHSDVSEVRLEVKGARISGVWSEAANELVAEMVRLSTNGSVPVTHSFDGKQIGWVFYNQAPIADQVTTILDGLDCFYSEDEATNSIEIKRRYNARFSDLDGTANDRAAFEFGESDDFNKDFQQVSAVARPKQVTTRYNRNFAPLSNSNEIDSTNRDSLITEWRLAQDAVQDGIDPEKVIDSALTQSADADEQNRMVADRYGIRAFNVNWVENNIGLGVMEGDVGTNNHRLSNPRAFTELRKVKQDTLTRKTTLTGVVYG